MTRTPKHTGFAAKPREYSKAMNARSRRTDEPNYRAIKSLPDGREVRWRQTKALLADPEPGFGGRVRLVLVSLQPDVILLKLKGRKASTAVRLTYQAAFALASNPPTAATPDAADATPDQGAVPPAPPKGGQEA